MALSLQEMRDFIRTHLDLEVEDLPDILIDRWLREGSKRIERAEVRWPYFEKIISYTFTSNPFGYYPLTGISSDLDQVAAIRFASGSFPSLQFIGHDAMDELNMFSPKTGRPRYFTNWAGSLLLYPSVDTSYATFIRGYRSAVNWIANGAGAVPDLPDELHNTVMTWGLSKAYAQQEDPEMASFFERQFSDEVKEMARRLVVMPNQQPLVMNGGHIRRTSMLANRPRFDWEVD